MLVALVALAAYGCARPKAQTVPEAPPLSVPAPPPRVIPAPPPDPPEESAPPTEETTSKPANRPRSYRPRAEASKPDPKKVEPPPVVEAPPATQPATLQPGPAATQTELERRARDQMARASDDLSKVRPNMLDPDAREQYLTAERFRNRAGEALAERNFIYAVTLAEKAATIAADLAKRIR